MSPGYKYREQQREVLAQQQRQAPYSQGMGSRPVVQPKNRQPANSHAFDPVGLSEGGAVRPQSEAKHQHQPQQQQQQQQPLPPRALGAPIHHGKAGPSGAHGWNGYNPATPQRQQHIAASGQYGGDSPKDFATMHLESKELL